MKIFGFVKKVFFIEVTILSGFTNANSLSCISVNNQECKTRPQVINVNGDEPVFFPFSIKRSKCSGRCNNINYPYAKLCVSDIVKNLNVKVFNLMSSLGIMFVIISNVGIKINADVNAKNQLIKEYVIKDLIGILVIVSVNVIKHVMLVNT